MLLLLTLSAVSSVSSVADDETELTDAEQALLSLDESRVEVTTSALFSLSGLLSNCLEGMVALVGASVWAARGRWC